jgi:hypothetical protein
MNKLKMLTLACIMAGAMNAQDFHGVSIGGTAESPTLVNNSGALVMAYSVRRVTSNNLNRVFDVADIASLVRGEPVQGALGLYTGLQQHRVNHTTGQMVAEGDAVRWELKGVMFSDGRYYGNDVSFKVFQKLFTNLRAYAQQLQQTSDQRASLEKAFNFKLIGLMARVDAQQSTDRQALARNLLSLTEAEWPAAIGRVSALPDVVKGE